VRRAIQLGRRDDAAAAIGEKRVSERSLSRCDGERGDAALKLGDPLLQNVCRGIGYAAVAKARDLQIEQCGRLVRALKFVGDVLIDGRRYGLGRRVANKAIEMVSLRMTPPRPRRREANAFRREAMTRYLLPLIDCSSKRLF